MAAAAEKYVTTAKRTHRQEKLARIYDDEVAPIWTQRFARMMLRGLEVPPKAMVLDVACGTGTLTAELLRKMDSASRLVAIDPSSVMLDVARKKVGELGGKRVFFRTEAAFPRLPFTADVYDLVLCNLGLLEVPSPQTSLKDFARVTKPGGQVVVTMPLAGTWGELHDIYREVLIKHDKQDILERLDKHIQTFPEPEEAERWLKSAGLGEGRVETEEITLLFKSSREFFFAPVVEYGPLPTWKEIAGRGQEMQDVFWYIKQAIDAYFGGRAFQITIKAGCLRGVKIAAGDEDAVVTGKVAKTDEDTELPDPAEISEEWLPVNTGEVEVLEDDVVEEEELDAFKEPDEQAPEEEGDV
jgi:ubiquinone/menaquinone biosynthesis C-methylase UbiE